MIAANRKIFIDTSVLIAFVDRGSSNHLRASKAIEDLASLGYRLYTSSQIVTDSYDLLLNGVGGTVALEFFQALLQSSIEVLYPQRADLVTAQRILKVNKDKDILLSEAVSATLMQKRGINQILTFFFWNQLFGTSISKLVGL